MIRTASIFALKRLPLQEQAAYRFRILVMGRWPRGISWHLVDGWLPAAAPSTDLLAAYRSGRLSWADFARTYSHQQHVISGCRLYLPVLMAGHTSSHRVQEWPCSPIELLRQLAQVCDPLTLLCWEPEGVPCHRHLLRAALTQPEAVAEGRNSHV